MIRPKTLQAFTKKQYELVHFSLAAKVATMLGRKFEEGDWAEVYCKVKGIPDTGWSNLNIDVAHQGLGVEHKMLCVKSNKKIKEYCGTTLMHPSATRSIRIPLSLIIMLKNFLKFVRKLIIKNLKTKLRRIN